MESEILERGSAVGSTWRGHYDRLALNTSRWYSTLSREPFPRSAGVFPTRDDFVRYLESYAERYEARVRYGVRVDRIDPCDGGWLVATSDGDRVARQVVVAMGHEHTPRLPDWPGRHAFSGQVLHASEYRNATGFAGADVLVVGAGNSAMDIAYDLAVGGAARVRIAVRTQPNINNIYHEGRTTAEEIARELADDAAPAAVPVIPGDSVRPVEESSGVRL